MTLSKRPGKGTASGKGGRKKTSGPRTQERQAEKGTKGRKRGGAQASPTAPPQHLAVIAPDISSAAILAWDDDPKSGRAPTQTDTPVLPADLLGITITDPAPAAGVYPLGTNEFRYWVAAEALTRGLHFWTPLLPAGTAWATPDLKLTARLDLGADLNAYYRRRLSRLEFFHFTVGGQTVFSGESPNVLCHELGHAILDAVRPQLYNAASIEAAALHEAFGDISAILCTLQVPAVREAIVEETGGRLYRTTFLSRVAEQMGDAIRAVRPDAVEPDCMRNAVNSFFYRDPALLPPKAPASALSSAPHSFGRIFTGAFFEAFAGMLAVHSPSPTPDDVRAVALDAGRILIEGVRNAPVVPNYFSQVSAHMIAADEVGFGRKYREALTAGFLRHGTLSLEAAGALTSPPPPASELLGVADAPAEDAEGGGRALPRKAISCHDFGLVSDTIVVEAPAEPEHYQVAASHTDVGSVVPPTDTSAARSFIEDLFRLGRVDVFEHADPQTRVAHATTKKTHTVEREGGHLILVRETFDCGFDD